MTRSVNLLLCSVMLLGGFAAGIGYDHWRLNAPAEAEALDPREADRLYQELGSSATTLFESSQVLAKIAALTTPSVVHIQSERASFNGRRIEETGSGVVLEDPKSGEAYIVTNRHVISDAPSASIKVHLYDGRVIHPTEVLSDQDTDVAVLRVAERDLSPARWGNSDQVQIGHFVVAMGSPFGLSQSVTLGIISAKGRRSLQLGKGRPVLNQDFLQTDAAINPGNSGGPLIDMRGQVIGINTAIASNSGGNEGIGFSIPSNLARMVVDQLLETGTVERAYLGVKLDPDFDAQAAANLKLDRPRGAFVAEVYPNTPAARANMKYADVILSFDGHDVHDQNHLINLVSLTAVGRKVRMVVWRDGKKVTLHVDLAKRPEASGRSE